jgi:hypothetical protein
MNYTNIMLIGIGTIGIILHNLVELNKLNKSNPGTLNFKQYFRAEIFAICIAFICVIVAVIIKHEIKQLDAAGKWLGLAFLSVGYMGQSLLVFIMGRAASIINKPNDEPNN